MKVLRYLNYKVYYKFIKQGDSVKEAIFTTCYVLPVIFFLNIFAIQLFISAFCSFKIMTFYLTNIFILLAILIILNYLLVYAGGRYKSQFNKIQQSDSEIKKVFFNLYFLMSFLMPGILAILINYIKTC